MREDKKCECDVLKKPFLKYAPTSKRYGVHVNGFLFINTFFKGHYFLYQNVLHMFHRVRFSTSEEREYKMVKIKKLFQSLSKKSLLPMNDRNWYGFRAKLYSPFT